MGLLNCTNSHIFIFPFLDSSLLSLFAASQHHSIALSGTGTIEISEVRIRPAFSSVWRRNKVIIQLFAFSTLCLDEPHFVLSPAVKIQFVIVVSGDPPLFVYCFLVLTQLQMIPIGIVLAVLGLD